MAALPKEQGHVAGIIAQLIRSGKSTSSPCIEVEAVLYNPMQGFRNRLHPKLRA